MITHEMVIAALEAANNCALRHDVYSGAEDCMRAAIQAALAARRPVAQATAEDSSVVTPAAQGPAAQKRIRQPIQSLYVCPKDGRLRFQPNAIVQHLLDHGGIDMNALARLDFPRNDREQFAQLIGYSHDGFGTLSYATDRVYDTSRERFYQRLKRGRG